MMASILAPADTLAVLRAGFLMGPALAACALVLICRPKPREGAAAMVAFLWQLPALLLLNIVAAAAGWWQFNTTSNTLAGMPIDVWIGWSIWWGPAVVLLNRWVPMWAFAILSLVIDLATMPRLAPLVTLGGDWLIGEAAAIVVCLLGGLYVAKLTREDRKPKRRAMFHVLGWGGYMAFVLPVAALLYQGCPLDRLYRPPAGASDWIVLAVALFLLFVGIAATAEFARAGDGTPIPYDPPKRVVATGPYAFNANPMQIISAAFMAMLALYAGSWGLALIAAMFLIFDGVYAAQYNRRHIAHAMPAEWSSYRGNVEDWRVRWRPHLVGRAEVLISPDGPAHLVWRKAWPWFSRHLTGTLDVKVGERSRFDRLVYRRPDAGIEDTGVTAAARILEHGPLPLAVLGWLIRFPYLGGALQRIGGLVIFIYRRYRAR
jgi:protein-S-isoprenylcysteine O-methyltransferase Ste14